MNQLFEQHIEKYPRPNFKKFTQDNFEEIARLSIGLEFNNEVDLADIWRVKYNQRISREERKGISLVGHLDKVHDIWIDIVKLSKCLEKMKRKYTIQSIEVLSAAAESAGSTGKAVFKNQSSSQPPAAAESTSSAASEVPEEFIVVSTPGFSKKFGL